MWIIIQSCRTSFSSWLKETKKGIFVENNKICLNIKHIYFVWYVLSRSIACFLLDGVMYLSKCVFVWTNLETLNALPSHALRILCKIIFRCRERYTLDIYRHLNKPNLIVTQTQPHWCFSSPNKHQQRFQFKCVAVSSVECGCGIWASEHVFWSLRLLILLI